MDMGNFQLTLDKVEDLINRGLFKEADEILRPHTRFPTPWWHMEICELETRIVDGLIALEHGNRY